MTDDPTKQTHGFQKGNQLWRDRTHVPKPRKFASPDEFLDAVTAYFEWSDGNPVIQQKVFGTGLKMNVEHARPLTIASACVHMGMHHSTWATYRERDDFKETIYMVESIMTEQKFAGAAVGIFNANIIARDLGLADKKEHLHRVEKIEVEFLDGNDTDKNT